MSSDVLVVSPHLDDAVLSAGGWIAEMTGAGHRVTVFTVFAGIADGPYSPVASGFHEQWGLPIDPLPHRREEDLRALNRLGAEAIHGDFLDAIYRTDPTGRWIVGDDSDPTEHAAADETELTSRVSEAVQALIVSLEPDLLLSCASVGDHVDHIHTCDAARAAAAATGVELRLWTDLPYDKRSSRSLPESVQARIGAFLPRPHQLGDQAWQAKLHALDEYASQHAMLWPGVTDIAHVMREQAATVGSAFGYAEPCELLWTPAGVGSD